MWYCRHEIQLRQAMFFSAASVAGAFSGLLAFGIAKMDGVGGLEGWRWIFILEGIVTVLVAFAAFFLLYDFPETAGFLTEEERQFVIHRLKYQGQTPTQGDEGRIQVAQAEEFRWEYVWQAFRDWQIWLNLFVYWAVCSHDLQTVPMASLADLRVLSTDCLPAVRNQPLPPLHHQQSRLHIKHCPAVDYSHLHHGLHTCRDCGVGVGSRWQAESVHHRVPVHDGHWLHHVSQDIKCV